MGRLCSQSTCWRVQVHFAVHFNYSRLLAAVLEAKALTDMEGSHVVPSFGLVLATSAWRVPHLFPERLSSDEVSWPLKRIFVGTFASCELNHTRLALILRASFRSLAVCYYYYYYLYSNSKLGTMSQTSVLVQTTLLSGKANFRHRYYVDNYLSFISRAFVLQKTELKIRFAVKSEHWLRYGYFKID